MAGNKGRGLGNSGAEARRDLPAARILAHGATAREVRPRRIAKHSAK